ncbi:GD17425 [Drosophila simulans]|uniref:GD17425 n=1 Tax=Drosophila simulans TaxID=7240 RepID=B4R7A5_DROSI|nr:GD17425 [Drosophila simulans]
MRCHKPAGESYSLELSCESCEYRESWDSKPKAQSSTNSQHYWAWPGLAWPGTV